MNILKTKEMRNLMILLVAGLFISMSSCTHKQIDVIGSNGTTGETGSNEPDVPFEPGVLSVKGSKSDNPGGLDLLFTGDHVVSFNLKTGEIILRVFPEHATLGFFSTLNFLLNENPLFELPLSVVSPISNWIYNDLTLVIEATQIIVTPPFKIVTDTLPGGGGTPGEIITDFKYYLKFGYPDIEVCGGSEEEKENMQKERDENMRLREDGWNTFINYLRDTDKLIEE
jgi:hypothetical protein